MPIEITTIFRFFAVGVFFATLYAGYYLFNHFDALFGASSNTPGENSSSGSLSKVGLFAILVHILFGSAAFALFMH
ncbi:MAG: hypothetical protein QM796_09625 [Chthoniobacteraceae bacterium]